MALNNSWWFLLGAIYWGAVIRLNEFPGTLYGQTAEACSIGEGGNRCYSGQAWLKFQGVWPSRVCCTSRCNLLLLPNLFIYRSVLFPSTWDWILTLNRDCPYYILNAWPSLTSRVPWCSVCQIQLLTIGTKQCSSQLITHRKNFPAMSQHWDKISFHACSTVLSFCVSFL